ncbi:hypothetical protein GGR53DRAFT_525087 [Hypoxylon sp. FL1150]|nr:hypothetical protein GGR53DRAFT_525087 [Hypoxylon sp. FL1150]
MTKRFSPIKLLKQPGFAFVGPQFCNGQGEDPSSISTTLRIYATLHGGNPKEDDHQFLKDSVETAVTQLFTLCIEKKPVFRVLDPNTLFDMIIEEWKPCHVLEPTHLHLILDSYVTAREKYAGRMESQLARLVDDFAPTWHFIKGRAATATSPSATATTTATAIGEKTEESTEPTTEPTVDTAPSQSWIPADFAPEERSLLSHPMLVDQLQGIDNTWSMEPHPPTNQSEPLDIQKFLCILALSYFPATHRFALYLRPVAFVNRSAKRSASDAVFGTVGGFVRYAHNMLNHYDRTMAIGLVTSRRLRFPKVVVLHKMGGNRPASDLRFVCYDPMSHHYDALSWGITHKVNEVFGRDIKEAWWGGWNPVSGRPQDMTFWTCEWIMRIVCDESALRPPIWEWQGYKDVISYFDSHFELRRRLTTK